MLEVRPIPAFQDNYIWCLDDGERAVVVDPGEAEPVIETLRERGLRLGAILVTHHHFDHVGGIGQLLDWQQVPVYGPEVSSPHVDHPLQPGDRFQLFDVEFRVIAVPGHTLDHIALYAEHFPGGPALFCGDTLFAAGCGRLFEGSPEQMFQSLGRLAELPRETQVFCAHEYTLNNLRFAAAVEPDNEQLMHRRREMERLRAGKQPTVPSRLADELATNPFLRCAEPSVRAAAANYANMDDLSAVETFAAVRRWKDDF